ncbi:peptidase C39 family protein [Pseudomonas sp. CAM1A]|uniref:peptidase C39 family protein n=1 Tax=Pseudomonas sp. CAM1A TaxID=3231717 RepID=UPI0039C60D17
MPGADEKSRADDAGDGQHRYVTWLETLSKVAISSHGVHWSCSLFTDTRKGRAGVGETVSSAKGGVRCARSVTAFSCARGNAPWGCGLHFKLGAARAKCSKTSDNCSITTPRAHVRQSSPRTCLIASVAVTDFYAELQDSDVEIARQAPDLPRVLAEGGLALVLISTYRLTDGEAPHWGLVTACDDDFVYLHNPNTNHGRHRQALDCQYLPVSHQEFQRMSLFGGRKLRAAVALFERECALGGR